LIGQFLILISLTNLTPHIVDAALSLYQTRAWDEGWIP